MQIFSPFLRTSSTKRRRPAARGFTLIELLVVSLIIIIITTFVLFQQERFNSSTLLRSLSYSVALSIRQAQVFGTSVRESAPGSGVFTRSGYGVYFPAPSGNYSYTLFSDNNSNGKYMTSGVPDSGEALPVYTLGKGYSLYRFCATLLGGAGEHCSSDTSPTITDLTIFFRRPNPDACIATSNAPGACAPGAAAVYQDAVIQVQAGNGELRTIKVSSTGQIAVCKPNSTDFSTC